MFIKIKNELKTLFEFLAPLKVYVNVHMLFLYHSNSKLGVSHLYFVQIFSGLDHRVTRPYLFVPEIHEFPLVLKFSTQLSDALLFDHLVCYLCPD